jgi:hypothetical protein
MGLELERDWDETLNPQLRASQIIVAALAGGALSFLLIAVLLQPSVGVPDGNAAPSSPMVFYVGLGIMCAALLARSVIPSVIEARGRRLLAADADPHGVRGIERSDLDGKLMALHQQRLIVAAALLEGVAFLMIIAYLVEHSRWALVVAAVLIGLILAHVPTRQRVSTWLAAQRRAIEEERSHL